MEQLSDSEIIRRALAAAVDGPYLPEWEFHTLFGLTRDDVRLVLRSWPEEPSDLPQGYSSAAEAQRAAVNNALNTLLGYPHGYDDRVIQDLGVGKREIALVLSRWREESFDPDARGYFDRLL